MKPALIAALVAAAVTAIAPAAPTDAGPHFILGSRIKPHSITGEQIKPHSLPLSDFRGQPKVVVSPAVPTEGSAGPTGLQGPLGGAGPEGPEGRRGQKGERGESQRLMHLGPIQKPCTESCHFVVNTKVQCPKGDLAISGGAIGLSTEAVKQGEIVAKYTFNEKATGLEVSAPTGTEVRTASEHEAVGDATTEYAAYVLCVALES